MGIQRYSAPVCFIDTVSSTGHCALMNYRLVDPNLSGQRYVAHRRLAARTRELMHIQSIVVHTNLRCRENRAISPPSMIQSC